MIIFMGVYLLNFPDSNSSGHTVLGNVDGGGSERSSEETQYDRDIYTTGPDGLELQRYDSRNDGEDHVQINR
jgi:hypothetical protein